MRRAVLGVLAMNVADAFTCTGFDPVYAPQSKREQAVLAGGGSGVHLSTAGAAVPVTSEDRIRQLNDGVRRYLSSVEESQRHHGGRVLQSANDPFDVSPVKPFRLDQVSLEAGSRLQQQQALDLEYMVWLDPNSILYNFRNTSGLPLQGAQPFGGWEDPNCLLRGHFSGHWLSASALMWNATRNATLQQHMQYVVAELGKCQAANAATPPTFGYLSGYPASQFTDLENLVPYPKQWSPYYTIHKIMAGLRDQYLYAGSQQALQLAEAMASYFRTRIDAVIARGTIALWYAIMNQEFGGMNEVLYDLYLITGNQTYADTAHLFDKPCFLGPLAVDADDLDGMHANAHIPVVIGAARRYEALGPSQALYSDVATAFHSIMTHDHSYATGNGNHGEYWGTPGRLGDTLDSDTEETCSSYNMLKLGRHVLGWTGDVWYADWYERLQINGILSTQNPNGIGIMIYMLPLSTVNGSSKGWGDPIYTMTCCYGTGLENFAKVADSIYFTSASTSSSSSAAPAPAAVAAGDADADEQTIAGAAADPTASASQSPTLFIAQFHSSTLVWDGTNGVDGATAGPAWPTGAVVTLTQNATWDDSFNQNGAPGRLLSTITFNIASAPCVNINVSLRLPSWIDGPASNITVNGMQIGGTYAPLTWFGFNKCWKSTDVVSFSFAFAPLRLEYIRDDRTQYNTTAAVMAGPYLLTSPSVIGSHLYGDATDLATWITPLTPQQRNTTSLAASSFSSLYIRHDSPAPPASMGVQVTTINPTQGTDGPDSSFVIHSPGLTAQPNTISIESSNYPGFYVCYPSASPGQPLVLMNHDTSSSSYNASCTFALITPGLSGAAGSWSLELSPAGLAGVYASWFANGQDPSQGGTLTAQTLQSGNAAFNSASTWSSTAANWSPPPFSYIARASAASKAAQPALPDARDYLLYPIHEAVTETYVAYFQVQDVQ